MSWFQVPVRRRSVPFGGVTARHAEPSWIYSADDDEAGPSDWLIDVALEAVKAARGIDLRSLAGRAGSNTHFVRVWPGEHYRLLAGMVATLRPTRVVEIGTYTGLSALAMLTGMGPETELTTFDVVPWQEIEGTALTANDFSSLTLRQLVDDVTTTIGFQHHSDLIQSADLIFLDAAKDGEMESRFMKLLASVHMDHRALLVLDDIRLQNMLATWRGISLPKLDLTSFGHWSGTGMVEVGSSRAH